MKFTTDISKLPLEVRRALVANLQHEDQARFAIAQVEQARIAQMYRNVAGPGMARDGIGPMRTVIHPYLRAYMADVYGQRTVRDVDFQQWLARRHPEFAVPEQTTGIRVGWTKAREANRLFHKSYPSP